MRPGCFLVAVGLWALSQISAAPPRKATTDELITSTAAAANAHPADANAWVDFGDMLMQKGRETADAAYCSKAEAAYKKALELDPKRLEALTGMAWVNGVRHEFEASISWARKALAVDSKNMASYGLMGDAEVEIGNYDQAFDDYQKMLDLRPDLSSYSRSAHLLQVTGDTRRATWLMDKAIQAGSPYGENTAWCRSQLALLYFAQGAYVPAQQILDEGLKRSPHDYRLLAAMGKVKAATKQYDSAIEYYRKSIEIAPQEDIVAALGDVLTVAGKPAEAKAQYAMVETIARLNKANGVKGDMITARFYADHDMKLPEALKMAEEEYATRKNVYQADTLAWCLYKNGRLDEARKTIKTALSRNTPESLFYFHQGMIEAKAGNPQAAKMALYKAESINPNFDAMMAPVAMKMLTELGAASPGSVASAKNATR